MSLTPFHLAIKVNDLAAASEFYGELLGGPRGRSSETWIDFDLRGHQLVCHLAPTTTRETAHSNPVDGENVPVPHFGVVLNMQDWQELAERLKAADVSSVIEPCVRFAGLPGEQATMFFLDPSGNALEFKAFNDIERQLFET